MIKKEGSPKTVQKYYSITQMHIDFIERFIKEKGMLSASDVVRQAIAFFHEKTFPDYVYRETASGEERKKKTEEANKFFNMSDDTYCDQELKAPMVTAESGLRFALIHTIGNSIKPIPVAGIKDKMANDPITVKYHLEQLRTKSIAEQLTPYMQELLFDDYAIKIPPNLLPEAEELANKEV